MGFACICGNAEVKKELGALLREAAAKAAACGLYFNGMPADNAFERIAEYVENEKHHQSK